MRVVAFVCLVLLLLAPAAVAQGYEPPPECVSPNDCDGDGFPDDLEEALGSDPEDPDDTPSFDITFSAEIIIGEDGSITIIWKSPGVEVQGYIIWSSNSPWVKLASLPPSTLSYKIDDPVPGTKYKITYYVGGSEPEGFIPADGDPNTLGGWSENTFLLVPGGGDGTGTGDGAGTGDGSGTGDGTGTGGDGSGTDGGASSDGLPLWFYVTLGVLLLAAIGLSVALIVQTSGRGAATA